MIYIAPNFRLGGGDKLKTNYIIQFNYMGKITKPVLNTSGTDAEKITLSATPTRFEIDISGSGDPSVEAKNQVTFHIVKQTTVGADELVMALKELFSYQTDGAEVIDWTDYVEESSTVAGELSPWTRTVDTVNDTSEFSVSFSTTATKLGIYLSSAQAFKVKVWATVAKVQ